MMNPTIEALTRPATIKRVSVKGVGEICIMELTRSAKQKFDAWLRPGGVTDEARDKNRDLKICTLCLVDESGDYLFDFDDQEFEDFAREMDDKAAAPWDEVAYQVLLANGYIQAIEEPEELLKK